jgi:hypothetical protein
MAAPDQQRTHQTFILRIWQEETEQEAGRASWRGHITDIGSGERRYVEDLGGVIAFLMPRLELMGERVGLRWRVRSWLKQRQRERS